MIHALKSLEMLLYRATQLPRASPSLESFHHRGCVFSLHLQLSLPLVGVSLESLAIISAQLVKIFQVLLQAFYSVRRSIGSTEPIGNVRTNDHSAGKLDTRDTEPGIRRANFTQERVPKRAFREKVQNVEPWQL